jgi:hypothetical protein
MRRSMTALAAVLLLAACGSDNNTNNTSQATCADYCSAMSTTCTGNDVQFTALIGDCTTYCNVTAWPAGNTGDQSGNTMGCRITHVGLAATAKAANDAANTTLHCGHAGPSGAGTCGTLCENYCFLALKNCTGANAAGLGFTDNASCLAACAAFPTTGAGAIIGGTVAPHGDNVQCRTYHAGAAGAVSPTPHCGHAQVISASAPGGTTANGPCRPGG